MTFYAVNLADTTNHKSPLDPVMLLIRPVLDRGGEPILCEGSRWDGTAIRVIQEYADNGRFEAIHDIIRKKIHKNHFRIYQSKTGNGGWKRI